MNQTKIKPNWTNYQLIYSGILTLYWGESDDSSAHVANAPVWVRLTRIMGLSRLKSEVWSPSFPLTFLDVSLIFLMITIVINKLSPFSAIFIYI